MPIWKRTGLYLTRKIGRTLLLFVCLVITAVFLLASFSLKNASNKELAGLRQTFGTGFVLQIDTENTANVGVTEVNGHTDSTYIGTKITDETIKKILELDGVTNYTLPREFDLVCTDLKLKPGMWAKTTPGETFTKQQLEILKQNILAYSCTDGELSKNFRTGALEISKGRNLRKSDRSQAVISEEMAARNGLFVGDSITIDVKEGLYQPTNTPHKIWDEPIELEIVGLFHMNFTQQDSGWTSEYGYMENNIYVDQDTHGRIDKIIKDNWQGELIDIGYPEVIFFVDDPKKTDSIIRQIKERTDIDTDRRRGGHSFFTDETDYSGTDA